VKKILSFAVATAVVCCFGAALTAQQTKTTPPAKKPVVEKAEKGEQGEKAEAKKPAAKVELPAAIKTAFEKAYPKATIKNVLKETAGGKTVYEVESVDKGLTRDLNYNPDGTVIDIEEEVAGADIPAAVSDAVKKMYPKATVTKAEKMTTGQVVTYELTLKGAPKPTVELTPDGKPVPAAKEPEKK